MAGHEMDYLVQSVDGGLTWTNVTMAHGMLEYGTGTGAIFFINTGNAATTRGTWLWLAPQSGGIYGTWRTANGGASWVQVDKNEHPHGSSQIYQPNNNGVVYMAGAYLRCMVGRCSAQHRLPDKHGPTVGYRNQQ